MEPWVEKQLEMRAAKCGRCSCDKAPLPDKDDDLPAAEEVILHDPDVQQQLVDLRAVLSKTLEQAYDAPKDTATELSGC